MEANSSSAKPENPWSIKGFLNRRKSKSEDKKKELKLTLFSILKEIILALVVIGIIFAILWAYTGYWPPMAIIESNSMMHGDDSSIGTMDVGDIVLIKGVSNRKEISTYIEGMDSDYKTYGSYGDVIAFKKNGGDGTPIIHRAVIWIEYNSSGSNNVPDLKGFGSFDIPKLNEYNIIEVEILNYTPKNIDLRIDLTLLLRNFNDTAREPHGGFLTKGDNNKQIDQFNNINDSNGQWIEPVKLDWVLGRAEGEVPALGLLKLYVTGDASNPGQVPPPSNINMLIGLVLLIIFIVIIYHLIFLHISRKRRKKREEEEERKIMTFRKQIDGRLKPMPEDFKFDSKEKLSTIKTDDMMSYLDNAIEPGEIGKDRSLQSKIKSKLQYIAHYTSRKLSFKSRSTASRTSDTTLQDRLSPPKATPVAKAVNHNSRHDVPRAMLVSKEETPKKGRIAIAKPIPQTPHKSSNIEIPRAKTVKNSEDFIHSKSTIATPLAQTVRNDINIEAPRARTVFDKEKTDN